MLKSKDGLLSVQVVASNKISDLSLEAADLYVVNVPTDAKDATALLKGLNDAPANKCLIVLTYRHTKQGVLKALANTTAYENFSNLAYGDFVSATYQSTSKRTGLSKLAEPLVVLYKGNQPAWDNTSWFRPDAANASNHWDLAPGEEPRTSTKEGLKYTSFGQTSWEFLLLATTLAHPPYYDKIVWALDVDDNLLRFVKTFQSSNFTVMVPSHEAALAVLNLYEKV